ncbi:MAG TPA: TIR domain-containing protein, partial [Myxococcota bacterium]|nr:TIR domain-containing protein [Myxococcota bacterium]
MARIFVSYKRKREDEDRTDTTDRLAEVRQRLQPGHELCIDEQIEGGAPWEKRLCEWLLYCDAAIVLVSEAAIRSEWCRREWQILHARAMVGSVRLIPVAVDVDRAGLNRVVPAGLDLNETVQLGAWQAVDARGDRAGWLDEVERALSDLPSGPRGTDDLLAVHRAWVRTCFEVLPALPGEPFALREIYQPLRCGVATWKDLREGRVRPYEPHAHEPDALEQVTALLRDERFRDLVVLQGPPGSGKSALCLQLCQRLEGLGFAPVLIRFRHLLLEEGREVEETLSEAIRLGPEGEAQPACPADALDRKRLDLRWKDTQISHTVIVLDGWDEVMLGSATYEAQLQAWLPRISNHFLRRPRQVRLVLTGRPSPDVEASRLSDDARVLTLRPLDDAGVRAMGDALRQRTNWGLTEDIVGRMAGLASTRGDAAGELIALPLLTLLAFRTVAGWGGTLEALLASRSRLYQALVDQTVDHAGKAKEMGTSPEHAVGGAVHQGGGDLRRLLQRTAAMVSLDRGESLSFSELERRLRGEPAWGRWLQRGTGARQLVVNYYFKGGRHDLGCEFVHKSFREYLFAEDLLAGMEELSAEEGSYPAARLGYWEDLRPGTPAWRLSRHLSRLLSPQWLSPEVRDHLFWLVEQAIAARPGRWIRLRDLLADVYGWWAEGVPLRPLGAPGDPTGWAAPLLLDEAR